MSKAELDQLQFVIDYNFQLSSELDVTNHTFSCD